MPGSSGHWHSAQRLPLPPSIHRPSSTATSRPGVRSRTSIAATRPRHGSIFTVSVRREAWGVPAALRPASCFLLVRPGPGSSKARGPRHGVRACSSPQGDVGKGAPAPRGVRSSRGGRSGICVRRRRIAFEGDVRDSSRTSRILRPDGPPPSRSAATRRASPGVDHHQASRAPQAVRGTGCWHWQAQTGPDRQRGAALPVYEHPTCLICT